MVNFCLNFYTLCLYLLVWIRITKASVGNSLFRSLLICSFNFFEHKSDSLFMKEWALIIFEEKTENWKLDIQINIILSGFYKKTIESDSLFIALLALLKKGDESESLLLLFKKEQFALHRSSKMSDESDSLLSLFLKEQFALVALYKKSSFKKKWFARKTKERIPNPAQSSWIWIQYGSGTAKKVSQKDVVQLPVINLLLVDLPNLVRRCN